MVMLGEILGELEASEVAVGEDASHHAGPLEHDEIAVERALRERRIVVEELGDAPGPVGGLEQVDDRPPSRCVALIYCPHSARHEHMQIRRHAPRLAEVRIDEN